MGLENKFYVNQLRNNERSEEDDKTALSLYSADAGQKFHSQNTKILPVDHAYIMKRMIGECIKFCK